MSQSIEVDRATYTALAKALLLGFHAVNDAKSAKQAVSAYDAMRAGLDILPDDLADAINRQLYYTLQAYPQLEKR